ncbi:MAG: leucine-rich repeat protein, partial [Bacteroidales bacterium]|nr:leucine-rich repeat protein [Bacteroidales bacterium]
MLIPNSRFEGYSYQLVGVAGLACENNTGLTKVDFSKLRYLTTIGGGAFSSCTNLTQVSLPASVTSCSPSMVINCPSLKKIVVDAANTVYASTPSGMWINKEATILYKCPEDYGTAGTTVITGTTTTFPFTIDSIAPGAFQNCKNIVSVTLNAGTRTLSDYAFNGCTSLHTAVVPSSVVRWGKSVFTGATALENLYVNISKETVSEDEFSGCKKTNLYVPNGEANFYKTDTYEKHKPWYTWKNFYDGAAYDHKENALNSASGQHKCAFTIHSLRPDTIDGVAYAGRATLVKVPAVNEVSTLNIPDYITYGGHRYAVTKVEKWVYPEGGFPADVNVVLGANVDTIRHEAFCLLGSTMKVISLKMNSKLKFIGKSAFDNCQITNDIVLPLSIETIQEFAFLRNLFKRFHIPSTINQYEVAGNALYGCSQLEELTLNGRLKLVVPKWNLGGVPSTCKIIVPDKYLETYKEISELSGFQFESGAYDFTRDNVSRDNTMYHISVITMSKFKQDGVQYHGTAQYVYHPSHVNQSGTFKPKGCETYTVNGANMNFWMRAIEDSTMKNCEKITEIDLSDMDGLFAIRQAAFQGTSVTKVTLPLIEVIGKDAFLNCKNLKEIFMNGWQPLYGNNFYGNNAEGFRCYVPWYDYYNAKSYIKSWKTLPDQTRKPLDQLYPWLKSGTEVRAFAVDVPVDWKAAGLKAYVVTEYNKDKSMLTTQKIDASAAGEGLLLDGLEIDKIYRLDRPATTPSTHQNMLVGAIEADVDVYEQKIGYYFYPSSKTFVEPRSRNICYQGSAYLLIPTSQGGNTTIEVDVWTKGLKGDVNGDGQVNV